MQQVVGLVPHASGFTVRHVMVLPQHAQHALLPMPAAELVTNDWVPVEAGLDVGPLQALASCTDDGHLVNNGCLTGLVLTGLPPCCNSRRHMDGKKPMQDDHYCISSLHACQKHKLGVKFRTGS